MSRRRPYTFGATKLYFGATNMGEPQRLLCILDWQCRSGGSLKIRAEDARRARVILMLADGNSYSRIEAAIPCYRDYINRWRRRFLGDSARWAARALSRRTAHHSDTHDGGPHPREDTAGASR